jgi:predicted phosphodiesterase
VDPLATPGRVGFAGDWHGNGDYAVQAVYHAAGRGADVLIQLGDFGYDFQARYLKVLTAALRETDMPLLFVDGNHECFPTLYGYPVGEDGLRQLTEAIWHLPRGMRWTWDGLRFLACGGAYSIDRRWREPGTSWWAGETVTDDDVQTCVDGGPADVLVSHDCPTGVDIPDLRRTAGIFPADALAASERHRQQLRRITNHTRPRWIWHGHYHVRHSTIADLGYGPMMANGLHCDGYPLGDNVHVVDLAALTTAAVSVEGKTV